MIPTSWISAELGQLVEVVYGKGLSEKHRLSKGLVPVVGSSGIVGNHNEALVTGPCVVVGRKGAAGSVHLIAESCWPIDTAYYIQPPSEIDLRYLSYQLGTFDLVTLDKSTAIPSLSRDDLYRVSFSVAPAKEQTRIVAKLEELLSDLDAGVAELKAAQKKLTKYRQSLLKAAVEGALTREWRESNKSTETGAQLLTRILKERRVRWEAKQIAKFESQGKAPPKDWQEKYPEPVKPDTTNLPELPEGWVWVSAEQICDFVTKGTTPSKNPDDKAEKTVPFLRVTNLTDTGALNLADRVFISKDIHNGFLGRSIVYPNDVLMNIVGPPLGQVSIVPKESDEWNINQAIAIFRAVAGVSPEFLCAFLLSASAQKWLQKRAKTTAGQTNLTLEVCRALPIPLPSSVEQIQIVASVNTVSTSVADQEVSVIRALKQSTAQRKNILKAAFSGQLVPQDPNDEPASKLLERIRAERVVRSETTKRNRSVTK